MLPLSSSASPHKRGTRKRAKADRYKTLEQQEYDGEVRREANGHTPTSSTSATAIAAGAYNEHYAGHGEMYDPDTDSLETAPFTEKSLTKRQHLRLFQRDVLETVTLATRQLDKKAVKAAGVAATAIGQLDRFMVPTTDTRAIKMSDRSLLLQTRIQLHPALLKRETSITHRVSPDHDADLPNRPREADDVLEEPIPAALDADGNVIRSITWVSIKPPTDPTTR